MRFAMLFLTIGFVAVSLAAQDTLPIAAGQRVRLGLDGHRQVTGVLKSQDGDSIHVQQYWNTPTLAIARTSIAGLEVSTKRHSNAGTGAAAGLLGGAAIGAMLGASCEGEFLCPGAGGGAASVGLLGLVLGGAIGALSHSEQWQSVYERRVQVNFTAPARGRGIGVGVAVAF